MNLSTSFRKSVVFQALSIVYSYVEQQTIEPKKRMLSQAIACVQPLFY